LLLPRLRDAHPPQWERLEAALPDVTAAAILLAVIANVSPEQPVHPLTQIAVAIWPNGQVKVVGQQAVTQEAHGHAGASVTDQIDKVEIIALAMKDLDTGIASVEDMVAEAANNSSGRTWHAGNCGQGRVA